MASETDIVNLSLARLGDEANVASIDPPEESVQAEHAAMFYPIARDAMLEMGDYKFSRRRITGATVTMPTEYEKPVGLRLQLAEPGAQGRRGAPARRIRRR
jgi:hypothetical protein